MHLEAHCICSQVECVPGFNCACRSTCSHSLFAVRGLFSMSVLTHSHVHMYLCLPGNHILLAQFLFSDCRFLLPEFLNLLFCFVLLNKCQPFLQLSLFLLLFLGKSFHPLPLPLPLAPFLFLVFYQYCHQFSRCKTFPLMTSLLAIYDF